MSRLTELYAERDLLRSRRAALEQKMETLVPLETKNRLAINALLADPVSMKRTAGSFSVAAVDHVEACDVPEFFNQRTVD